LTLRLSPRFARRISPIPTNCAARRDERKTGRATLFRFPLDSISSSDIQPQMDRPRLRDMCYTPAPTACHADQLRLTPEMSYRDPRASAGRG